MSWFRRDKQKDAVKPALPGLSARRWLVLCTTVCLLPQSLHMPWWISLTAALLLVFAGLRLQRGVAEPPRLLKLLVVLVAMLVTLVAVLDRSLLLGLVILLVMGNVMKLLELRSMRDAWVIQLVNCFSVAAVFLFSTSMLAGLWGLLSVLILLASLVSLHSGTPLQADSKVQIRPLHTAGMLLLQALPLALLIFLIFPRFDPLWTLQLGAPSGRTGLSDSISPGEISNLLRSDEMAFRVSFSGEPLVETERYWRAMTFDHFDGQRWRIDPAEEIATFRPATGAADYEVIAEPAQTSWLISQGRPAAASEALKLFPDGTVRAPETLERRFSYGLQHSQAASAELTAAERSRYLQVPPGNPRIRQQVQQWLAEGLEGQALVERILQQYQQRFTYTLSPQRLSGNRIDEFYFDSQEGFCEHFASSTGFMLRLAGIPTRLVGGYLGGEWNPYSEYLLIRQYDAHAWVEAWLDGRWQRIDPTAAVSPERVEQGIEDLLQSSPGYYGDQPLSMVQLENQFRLLAELRLRYQSLNYSWHRWVLGYDSQQDDLLQAWFGQINYLKSVLLIFVPVAVVLVLVAWWLLRARPRYSGIISRDVEQLSARLGRLDPALARQPGETLQAYSQRLAVALPGSAAALRQWYQLVAKAEYDIQSPAALRVYKQQRRSLLRKI